MHRNIGYLDFHVLSFNNKYSNILRIKIISVYVKDFLISTKVRLKRGELYMV